MKNLYENETLCHDIFDAIRINSLPAVRAYLVFGATIATRDTRGWTPLHHAAWHNHQEIFSFLVSRGADLSAMTRAGEKPYHLAVRNNATDVLAWLCDLKWVA